MPPSPQEPPQTSIGLTQSAGHLRIQYESPTASFDTSLEDDLGQYIPDHTCLLPEKSPVPDPFTSPDRDAQSLSCLMATCSFYDHMMHVWRWDWSPEKEKMPSEPTPSSWTVAMMGCKTLLRWGYLEVHISVQCPAGTSAVLLCIQYMQFWNICFSTECYFLTICFS